MWQNKSLDSVLWVIFKTLEDYIRETIKDVDIIENRKRKLSNLFTNKLTE
jgi:hypothetical protein